MISYSLIDYINIRIFSLISMILSDRMIENLFNFQSQHQ